MAKKIYTIILFISLFSLILSIPKEYLEGYSLIFKENFENEEDFEKNWDFEIGTGNNGWGNQEKQYYRTSSNNIFIKENQLHIKAKKEKILNNNYSSGRLSTKNTFQFTYGYVKTRLKLPKVNGLWPCFWILGVNYDEVGWPKCGEIDIAETKNDNDNVISVVHWYDDVTKLHAEYGTLDKVVQNKDEFHIYELLWDEKYIRIFYDDVQIYIMDIEEIKTDAFTKPFYFIINLALGGNFVEFDIDDRKLPSEMVIDYIEVYQKKNNFKYNPKELVLDFGNIIMQQTFKSNDKVFLKNGKLYFKGFYEFYLPNIFQIPSFKYGEFRMQVSLPDAKGMISKIYLFRRAKFNYFQKNSYYIYENTDIQGDVDLLSTRDGSGKIISGAKWGPLDQDGYYKEIDILEPKEFNEYLIKWDKNYITIYGNDVEIYKIDITELNVLKDYYFLYFKNEKTSMEYKGGKPEIIFKEIKIYQHKSDYVIGLIESTEPDKLNELVNIFKRIKLNSCLLFLSILIMCI